MRPIRVMLVDDHAVVRTGLATFLAVFEDLELVAEAGSGEEALRLATACRPDVVLMDLVMPGMDGVTTTRMMRDQLPGVQVVVLTSFREEALVHGALQAGAIGYLLKDVSATALADAVRAAYHGQPTLAPEATQALIHAAQNPPLPAPEFTGREQDVLTSFREEALVHGALQAGAIGYLLKDVSATALAEAVRAAYHGQPTLAPEATQALIHAAQNPPLPAPEFTGREQDVLRLMVQGMSNAQIAEDLVVSISTVKFHVSNILSKLGVSSRTEAVALALQEKLV